MAFNSTISELLGVDLAGNVRPALTYPTAADPFTKGQQIHSSTAITYSNAGASAVTIMMGYGSTFSFTPQRTGNVLTFCSFNHTSTSQAFTALRYGTGTAPIFGASSSGFSCFPGCATRCFPGNVWYKQTRIASGCHAGVPQSYSGATADNKYHSSQEFFFYFSGLTVGTTYWFDFQMFCEPSPNTATIGWATMVWLET